MAMTVSYMASCTKAWSTIELAGGRPTVIAVWAVAAQSVTTFCAITGAAATVSMSTSPTIRTEFLSVSPFKMRRFMRSSSLFRFEQYFRRAKSDVYGRLQFIVRLPRTLQHSRAITPFLVAEPGARALRLSSCAYREEATRPTRGPESALHRSGGRRDFLKLSRRSAEHAFRSGPQYR